MSDTRENYMIRKALDLIPPIPLTPEQQARLDQIKRAKKNTDQIMTQDDSDGEPKPHNDMGVI